MVRMATVKAVEGLRGTTKNETGKERKKELSRLE